MPTLGEVGGDAMPMIMPAGEIVRPGPLIVRVAMFRSVLARTLLAAFLATLPVTGAGVCPCRFAHSLGTPVPAPTAPSQNRKCCRHAFHRDAPERPSDSRPAPAHRPDKPSDAPCGCHCAVVASPGVSGDRSGAVRGVWDAVSPTEAGVASIAHGEAGPQTKPVEPARAPVPRPHFRYAHAFRC